MDILTTHKIAKELSCDISTVIKWIDHDKLSAYRTPGGHRRVHLDNLISFLNAHNIPIPKVFQKKKKKTNTILIVDDEEVIRRTLKRVIAKMLPGVKTEEACDGFETGQKLSKVKPDLVILDIGLPGMDGFKVCHDILKDSTLQGTRVLAVTGYGSETIGERIKEAGAHDFLPKPFDLDVLVEKIKNLISAQSP